MSTDVTTSSPLLNVAEAAKYLGIGSASLRTHMKQGTGPSYIPLGPNGGKIRFRTCSLDDWLRDREMAGRTAKVSLNHIKVKP